MFKQWIYKYLDRSWWRFFSCFMSVYFKFFVKALFKKLAAKNWKITIPEVKLFILNIKTANFKKMNFHPILIYKTLYRKSTEWMKKKSCATIQFLEFMQIKIFTNNPKYVVFEKKAANSDWEHGNMVVLPRRERKHTAPPLKVYNLGGIGWRSTFRNLNTKRIENKYKRCK